MVSNIASPAFINPLLPQPFAAADIEDCYSYKQRRRRDENHVKHHGSIPPVERFNTICSSPPVSLLRLKVRVEGQDHPQDQEILGRRQANHPRRHFTVTEKPAGGPAGIVDPVLQS
jgi:hypothetical protein